MKTLTLAVSIFLTSFTTLFAQTYQEAMGMALMAMSKAETADDLQVVANTFDRISQMNTGDYLPDYYAALNLINKSFYLNDPSDRDAVIGQAMEFIAKADKASPGNDEVEVLRGYANMAKMVIDPASRGQQYSPVIMQSFGKAMSMDPTNPRARAMMARMEMGTAQFFGSEPTKACGLASGSIELFEKETPQGFEPTWGRDIAEEVLTACNKK